MNPQIIIIKPGWFTKFQKAVNNVYHASLKPRVMSSYCLFSSTRPESKNYAVADTNRRKEGNSHK